MTTSEARPLRRDAQRNRERILQAAGEVFARRGFAATLDDVAHEAGVGIGTVYRRFPTKESLVEALFTDLLDELVQIAEDGLTADSAWDGLVDVLRRTGRRHATDRGLRDAALSIGIDKKHFQRVGERIVPLMQRLVDRAHAEGTLRADVGIHDLPIIMAMISDLPVRSAGVRPDLPDRYLQLIIDGLRAGPANSVLDPPLSQAEAEAILHECVPTIDPRRPPRG